MTSFKHHFWKPAQNIKQCKQLKETQKRAFFAKCATAGSDKDDIRKVALDHFCANKLVGSRARLPKGANLGRLHQWESLAKSIARSARGGSSPARVRPLKRFQERFIHGSAATRRLVVEELLAYLSGLSIAPVVWAFVQVKADRAFVGKSYDRLACRLGLEPIDGEAYFPMAFDIPICAIKNPTAFDAGLYEHWCAGGKTCPREACKKSTGFREVVMPGYAVGSAPDGLRFSDATVPAFG